MEHLENEDFLEYLEEIEEEIDNNRHRLPKRYIRDMENPMEFYGEVDFRNRYRFSKNMVIQRILPLVNESLRKINNRGLPFAPVIQLLICLRFYATGNFQTVSGDLRGVSQQSVSTIIKKVSILLAEKSREFIRYPDNAVDQQENIAKFNAVAGFPGVAGCLDCTHIPIANPGGNNGEVFRNRKGYFSLNVQVLAGPHMEILDIVVRHPGSTHDSVIFDRSALRVRFQERRVQGLLLGDNGYPCRPYLLTPVIHPANHHEQRYNSAHIRTRNIVERVFGLWKRKFPCLRRVLTTNLETSVAIICAAAVLYNISKEENYLEHNEDLEHIPPVRNAQNDQLGLAFRRDFINRYF